MKSFGKTVKLFFKSPQILVAYLMLLGMSNVLFIQMFKVFKAEYEEYGAAGSTDSIYFFSDMSYACGIFFVFWVFISYEYFRKSKEAGIREILDCLGARGSIFYFQQLGTLLLAVLVLTVNVGFYMAVGYFQLNVPPVLQEQIYKMLVVDIFLLSVSSVFCGAALSEIKNRFVGYGVALALSFFMAGELLEQFAAGLGRGGDALNVLRSFLSFIPPDTMACPDALYGLPLETYRIAIMGIWVILGSIWILRKACIRSKQAMTVAMGVCVVLLVGLGEMSWNRGSVLMQGECPQSALRENLIGGEEPETRTEEAGFAISGYQMELRVRKELSAVCKMELTENGAAEGGAAGEYHFTLFHGYRVKDVRDDKGEKMEFRQEGDYVIVNGDQAETVKEITFYYEGGSNLFYSNSHACFLTGIFPWYPKAGFQRIYTDTHEVEWLGDPETSFDIGMDIPGEVVSNLEYSEGRYKGKADNVLFIKGYFDSEYYEKTNNVCYPMQHSSYDVAEAYASGQMQRDMDEWMQYLGAEAEKIEKKKVICIPSSLAFTSRLQDYYETDSYILSSLSGTSPNQILRYRLDKICQSELTDAFNDITLDVVFLKERAPAELTTWREMGGAFDKAQELHDLVVDKMKEVGMQETLRVIYARIISDDYAGDLDSDFEFVKNIGK